MKTRLIAALCMCVLCGCAADRPHAEGSFADGTFRQEIGKLRQPLFQPDCPVR